jgi:hypothetical protein
MSNSLLGEKGSLEEYSNNNNQHGGNNDNNHGQHEEEEEEEEEEEQQQQEEGGDEEELDQSGVHSAKRIKSSPSATNPFGYLHQQPNPNQSIPPTGLAYPNYLSSVMMPNINPNQALVSGTEASALLGGNPYLPANTNYEEDDRGKLFHIDMYLCIMFAAC